jgi:LAS superfamily LD-carboxypeptidase LdcB
MAWVIINPLRAQKEKQYLLGQFDPATHADFVRIDQQWAAGSAIHGYLRKEAYEAFVRMARAAAQDGVTLTIISATRTFDRQKAIWENKWNGKVNVEGVDLRTVKDPTERARRILRFSSMPGTSRHHWGTDFDLNALENEYFESGEGLRVYRWLQTHAATFGFCQPYTNKATGRSGYEEEKWHWSYVPLSADFLQRYNELVQPGDLTGFAGSDADVNPIGEYVNGVACRQKP